MIRVLLYADVDLNLIDGSSVWLAALAELLAGSGEVEAVVLQRTALRRDVVIRDAAANPAVAFVDPWHADTRDSELAAALAFNAGPRLHPATAASLIRMLDARDPFDLLLVRSIDTASILAGDPRYERRLWTYVTDPLRHRPESDAGRLRRLFEGSRRFVCQSEEARDAFASLIGTNEADRFVLLPPIVTAGAAREQTLDPERPRLGYSGKFSSHYLIDEILDAFARIRTLRPGAEFHVVGDKFHNAPRREGFVDKVRGRLEGDSGVFWHGGVTRAEAAEIVAGVHLTASWRDPSFDSSVEISTKVLESAAVGVPPLLNPTPIQRRIFGADYAGYVDSEQAFVERFLALTATEADYRGARDRAVRASRQFLPERALERVLPVMRQDARDSVAGPCRVLFAGHDFKFLTLILERVRADRRYTVTEDRYSGHTIPDTDRSDALLAKSDVVFCEWCLGNAEWYSRNKAAGQRLVVRLHSQELNTPYLERVDWDGVDAVVFICGHHQQAFLDRFPFMRRRTALVYNALDTAALDLPKQDEARFMLGLLGMSPRQKSPHLALELLTRLRAVDSRYRLSIKGKRPEEYDWLWRRPEERAYYEELYRTIERPELHAAVTFEEFGDDVPAWLTRVGIMLSMSEREGSHQAVAEGMASGAMPVIRDWPGAAELYPPQHVFRHLDEAADAVLGVADGRQFRRVGAACKRFARERFDRRLIGDQWDELLTRIWRQARVPEAEAA